MVGLVVTDDEIGVGVKAVEGDPRGAAAGGRALRQGARVRATSTQGQARPSELHLHEGRSAPSSATHTRAWQLNPHERTHGLSSQTAELGHKRPGSNLIPGIVMRGWPPARSERFCLHASIGWDRRAVRSRARCTLRYLASRCLSRWQEQDAGPALLASQRAAKHASVFSFDLSARWKGAQAPFRCSLGCRHLIG
jgi:hypothetical protein